MPAGWTRWLDALARRRRAGSTRQTARRVWSEAGLSRRSFAWIGAGRMGEAMCAHLLSAGHEGRVFSRTAARCAPLVEQGALLCATPKEAALGVDVAFTCVGTPADVEAVTLGADGVLAGLRRGALLVDHTTSTPTLAKSLFERGAAAGVHVVDAPVSGGDVGARAGKLVIMVGGTAAAVGSARPLLDLFGASVHHMGEAGAGQHTKMANQILACSNMVGMAESLLYAREAGLDVEAVVRAIGSGAAGSWAVQNLGARAVAQRDFAPGFSIEHMEKDLGLALREAASLRLDLPGLAHAHRLYKGLLRRGHGKDGTQAIVLALEHAARGLTSPLDEV